MDGRVEGLIALTLGFEPSTSRAAASKESLLTVLRSTAEPFDSSKNTCHVTASAIVLSTAGVLLHRHKRFDIWVGPGGHIDGTETAEEAIVRETQEEAGLHAAHPKAVPTLIDVDIHAGPKGHIHLDTRWLLLSRPDAPQPGTEESQEVVWLPPERARLLMPPDLNDALDRALQLYGREVGLDPL